MKRRLLLVSVFLVLTSIALAQKVTQIKMLTGYSAQITGDGFEGAVFEAKYTSPWLTLKRSGGIVYSTFGKLIDNEDSNEPERFSPTIFEITLAETLLRKDLKQLVKKIPAAKFVQGPEVNKNLEKYVRQYFGFINKKGEKIVLMNCFWDESERKDVTDWIHTYYHVYGGGNYYWEAKINLTTREVYDFGVHWVVI